MSVSAAPSETEATVKKAPATSEALTLRGVPQRPVRLNRPAIVTASATALIAISISLWVALGREGRQSSETSVDHDASTVPAEIRDLPDTYAGAPVLGPKLPGDLGRPILLRQRQDRDYPPADLSEKEARKDAPGGEPDLPHLARGSDLMVAISAPPVRAVSFDGAAEGGANSPVSQPRLPLSLDTDPNAQQRKSDFLAGQDRPEGLNPYALVKAASPDMIMAGSIISASLITGIESDLPGLVIAQVTERVFDSVTGAILLIPQGTRLMGSYDSVVAYGQKRAFVVWQRLIFPDGSTLAIENVPAADPSGKSGLADRVNSHALALLQGAAISTMIGVGADLSLSGESDLVRAVREGTQQTVSRAGDQLTSRNLQVQPSISIRPGAPVRMIVHRDLVLKPWSK